MTALRLTVLRSAIVALIGFGLHATALAREVWLQPIVDDVSGQTDGILEAAVRTAAAIVAADTPWHAGRPGVGECLGGCDILEIHGHRQGDIAYVVTLERLPGAFRRQLPLESGVAMAPFELAQALALHGAFLVKTPDAVPMAAATDPQTGAGVRSAPPARRTRRIAADVQSLAMIVSAGPSLSMPVRRGSGTGGSEVAAALALAGRVRMEAAVGLETGLTADRAPTHAQLRVIPATIVAAAGWNVGHLALGVGAGVRWANWTGEAVHVNPWHDRDVSLVAQTRLTVLIAPRLTLDVVVRPTYAVIGQSQRLREAAIGVPAAQLQTIAGLTLRL